MRPFQKRKERVSAFIFAHPTLVIEPIPVIPVYREINLRLECLACRAPRCSSFAYYSFILATAISAPGHIARSVRKGNVVQVPEEVWVNVKPVHFMIYGEVVGNRNQI